MTRNKAQTITTQKEEDNSAINSLKKDFNK